MTKKNTVPVFNSYHSKAKTPTNVEDTDFFSRSSWQFAFDEIYIFEESSVVNRHDGNALLEEPAYMKYKHQIYIKC